MLDSMFQHTINRVTQVKSYETLTKTIEATKMYRKEIKLFSYEYREATEVIADLNKRRRLMRKTINAL